MGDNRRAQFATRMGVVAATVGSAVGLGNIWRFPYEAGVHGGAAFMLLYMIFVFVIGMPVMCAEFVIGRRSGTNVRMAFARLGASSRWNIVGYMGIVASILILGFYSVVAGWTMEYIYRSITTFGIDFTPDAMHTQFDEFASSNWRPALWTVVFLLCNYVILARGVEKGIERASNILMPSLFIILLAFAINSLSMPRAAEGLKFLFAPDFSKLTPSVVLGAMGQAFFSLSLGLGCLITYAGYFSKRTPLLSTAFTTATLDTLVAILAGIIIFPAVFSYGGEVSAGPKLVFEVLPVIFASLPFGQIWSVLFFILLLLASITSTVSMSEISIAWLVDNIKMSRRKATMVNTAICLVLGVLCALSFGCLSDFTIFGLTLFNLFDYVASNILLPLGGIVISVFAGWILPKKIVLEELAPKHKSIGIIVNVMIFCMRYIAPVGIAIVFIAGII